MEVVQADFPIVECAAHVAGGLAGTQHLCRCHVGDPLFPKDAALCNLSQHLTTCIPLIVMPLPDVPVGQKTAPELASKPCQCEATIQFHSEKTTIYKASIAWPDPKLATHLMRCMDQTCMSHIDLMTMLDLMLKHYTSHSCQKKSREIPDSPFNLLNSRVDAVKVLAARDAPRGPKWWTSLSPFAATSALSGSTLGSNMS